MSKMSCKKAAPAAWLRAWGGTFPWIVMGGLVTALPFVLSKEGLSFERITKLMVVLRLPGNFSFLLVPLLDSGWSRGAYSRILIVLTAICTAAGVTMLGAGHQNMALWTLFAAYLGVRLYNEAVGGWIARFTRHGETGAVGAWDVAFESAGNTAVYLLFVGLLTSWKFPHLAAGIGSGLLVLLGAVPMLFFPAAEPAHFRFRELFRGTLGAVWEALRRPQCIAGLMLFALPLGTGAAANMQDALGKDFHTADRVVVWVGGIGGAIFGCLGAPLGGWLATRWRDELPSLYLSASLVVSGTSLVTAMLPHTPAVFVGTTLFSSVAWGFQIAVYAALTLDLVHDSPVASTQMGLFASAFFLSQTYMSLADGFAYTHGGVTALFLTDGLPALLFAVPALFALRALQERSPLTGKAA